MMKSWGRSAENLRSVTAIFPFFGESRRRLVRSTLGDRAANAISSNFVIVVKYRTFNSNITRSATPRSELLPRQILEPKATSVLLLC